MQYSAAVVGTGANPEKKDRTGYAMAYRHAPGYQRLDNVELIACADIVRENAEAFADRFDIKSANVYEEYAEMLAELDIDILSVCTPSPTHAEIVLDLAQSGVPQAIHCEKPMATTWGDCQEMVETCERHDVQFTIDHHRRFGEPFIKAKDLLDDDTIGDLQRLECGEVNLFDAGVHQYDLCGFYTDRVPPKWVLANIDYSEENRWFGTHNETQGLAQWQYTNGVTGLAITGEEDGLGTDIVGCYLRLIGTDGVIELGVNDGPALRYRRDGQDWTTVKTNDTIHAPATGLARAALRKLLEKAPVGDPTRFERPNFYERAIEEVVDALEEKRKPTISGRKSLQATEIAFAAWESVRQRGRVDLPLEVVDNPLEAMVADGVFDLDSDDDQSALKVDSA